MTDSTRDTADTAKTADIAETATQTNALDHGKATTSGESVDPYVLRGAASTTVEKIALKKGEAFRRPRYSLLMNCFSARMRERNYAVIETRINARARIL